MEGYNPSLGCYIGCKSCYRGWVPNPLHHFPRRDPLIDSIGRTASPCDRPARYPPDCAPVPKFSLPREEPYCNVNCYAQEKQEAKYEEDVEKCRKYTEWAESLTPYVEVKSLDPSRPLCVKGPDPPSPYKLVDRPVRTDILMGTFNPDDNKSAEQLLRERCDRFYINCKPELKQYPCRGVINFPRQEWIDTSKPFTHSKYSICSGTKYEDPDFQQRQLAECQQRAREKAEIEQMKFQEAAHEWEKKCGACYPPGCR